MFRRAPMPMTVRAFEMVFISYGGATLPLVAASAAKTLAGPVRPFGLVLRGRRRERDDLSHL